MALDSPWHPLTTPIQPNPKPPHLRSQPLPADARAVRTRGLPLPEGFGDRCCQAPPTFAAWSERRGDEVRRKRAHVESELTFGPYKRWKAPCVEVRSPRGWSFRIHVGFKNTD